MYEAVVTEFCSLLPHFALYRRRNVAATLLPSQAFVPSLIMLLSSVVCIESTIKSMVLFRDFRQSICCLCYLGILSF
jgi:hypothetical protein